MQKTNTTIDMTGKKCQQCKKGIYKERELQDDFQGMVTCSCGHRVKRWTRINDTADHTANK